MRSPDDLVRSGPPRIGARARAGVVAVAFALSCGSVASASALHPGDQVSVTVYNHPELSIPLLTLDATGRASLGLAGAVDAAGVDESGLAKRIAVRLRQYIPQAAVDVRLIAQGQQIFVTGDRGGILKYSPGETLVAALHDLPQPPGGNITVASGPAAGVDLAHGPIDLHDVRLLRDGAELGPYQVDAMIERGESGPALFPGDTLRLTNKPLRVSVQGEVKQAGWAYLADREPLAQAVAQVGGELPTAWTSHVSLTRDGTTRTLSLGDPEFAQPARPGDAIEVPRAPRVDVVGLVVKPGPVLLQGDATLMNALYEAGGPTTFGNLRSVAVLHRGERREYDITKLTQGAHDANPVLADGDTIFLPEGHRVDFRAVFQTLASLWWLPSSGLLRRI